MPRARDREPRAMPYATDVVALVALLAPRTSPGRRAATRPPLAISVVALAGAAPPPRRAVRVVRAVGVPRALAAKTSARVPTRARPSTCGALPPPAFVDDVGHVAAVAIMQSADVIANSSAMRSSVAVATPSRGDTPLYTKIETTTWRRRCRRPPGRPSEKPNWRRHPDRRRLEHKRARALRSSSKW